MKRRNFVKNVGYSSLLLSGLPILGCTRADKPLQLLVLGGTNYLGPAVVNAALRAGHEVTLFNRGITNPDLFPNVERLIGDRNLDSENLDALRSNRTWDYVIDTWPADPRMVERSAKLLQSRVKAYAFTSSIAVYSDKTVPGITESSPIHKVEEYLPGMSYYQSKVLCEEAVRSIFPKNHLITRPPGIHGKRDESWTLVYWLWRIRNGGDILAPGDGKDPLQYVDVNDVGHFTIQALESKAFGLYNTIGPRKEPLLWQEFLNRVNSHYGNKANFIWVDKEFLEEKNVRPVVDLPMWESRTRRSGRHTMDSQKAIASGLTFTAMGETFNNALNWYDHFKSPTTDPGLDKDRPFNGITRERELELLQAWRMYSTA
ncbi:MAG: NAD-dependent epimerase/dehydratase family protein [Bacteroidota bacterium]